MVRRLLMGTFVTTVAVLCVAAAAQGAQGRWKIQGDACVFDPDDGGPDQCSATMGRWKIAGDACVFDANDSGPDQCSPPASDGGDTSNR
jgi:hypothetical protein